MKSLLLHAQNDSGFEARLQAALDIARATQGHLSCLHVTPTSAYVATEPFGGMFIMQDIMKMLDEQEQEVRKLVETRLAKEDVSWDYEALNTDIRYGLVDRGSLSDLIVMSHPPHRKDAPVIDGIIGDVIVDSRTPVLVVPEGMQAFKVKGSAVVAWNDSFEAANALRAAVPLLKLAEKVTIVTIGTGKQTQEPSPAPAEYLSRQGIHAEIHNEAAGQTSVQEALKVALDWLDADYLVMGAYGHSRAREYWFGGVTRSMLHEPPVPILFGR
jgi:nucleotide-binding universal stress UspA family protein